MIWRTKKKQQGLHFPKCGTSFGSTLHGYLCQKEPSAEQDPYETGKKFGDRDIQSECAWCGDEGKTFQINGVTVKKGKGWRGCVYSRSNRRNRSCSLPAYFDPRVTQQTSVFTSNSLHLPLLLLLVARNCKA